ncbi:hypothetical protein H9Y04_29605 [Streptomyces sp. TRM66268-LWL]|uniref:Gram-positive cocci surface proteins LPxTG domain-containing protein n=1 Tax=Streptomyces polyasparticus TaxID=2767826 RepID=A0ABR7SQ31_9ACTN|nr:hypothetical protein [Streptomyces polyasparticus]MBC9716697.1 hypothetical protein [Streptomyces polyasparticus]
MSALGVALMLGGAGILLTAAPAQAAESTWKAKCTPSMGSDPIEGTSIADITAPAEAKVGDEIEVTWKFVQAASKNPDIIDLPADSLLPTGTIKAAGAQTGDIKLEGPRKNPAIPKGGDMKLADMKGKFKLTAPGDLTLTPDVYNINAKVSGFTVDTECVPLEKVPTAVTVKVTGEPAPTTGGGNNGGTTTSGGTTTTGGGDNGGTTTSGGTTAGGTTAGGTTAGGTTSTGGGDAGGGGGGSDFKGKEATVDFECASPSPKKNIKGAATVNAKKNGNSYDLTVSTAKGLMTMPMELPANAMAPSMKIKVSGAETGSVDVKGPANKEKIPKDAPVALSDMTGTYKPGADGKVGLSPGDMTISVNLGGQDIKVLCKAVKTNVSLELDVKDDGGVAGGGDSGSTASAGTDGGNLAETGAESDGALRALGLVAGTVILLGGAVFTFMPRRRTQ